MLKDKIARLILDNAEPTEALLGFATEAEKYRESEPVIFSGFMKNACSILGRDFLVDSFINSAKDQDIHLIQTIEKKAFTQKITRDEIANYLEQGGLTRLLQKNAFNITKKINSEIKPELRKVGSKTDTSIKATQQYMHQQKKNLAVKKPNKNPSLLKPVDPTWK